MVDTKVITLICVVVIILVAGSCVFFVLTAKEDCTLAITSNEKLYVGNSLTVKLLDSKGNPILNRTICVKLTGSDGVVTSKNITTDSNGEAKFKLDKKGNYSVESSFNGDKHYSSNTTSTHINVKKKNIKTKNKSTINNHNHNSGLSEDGCTYYPEYGPAVDSLGYTREYAIAHNWHYIPQTIDGHDAGMYVPYDPVAGCYHT